MKKKLLSILLSLAMVVTMMPMATMTAFADPIEPDEGHDLIVMKGNEKATMGVEYRWIEDELQIMESGLTVSSSGETTDETIAVLNGVTELTIKDLSIDVKNTKKNPVYIGAADPCMIVKGENTLSSSRYSILCSNSCTITGDGTFTTSSKDATYGAICATGTLTLDCSGTIKADSEKACAISSANIVVTKNTGKIIAYSNTSDGVFVGQISMSVHESLVKNGSVEYGIDEKNIDGEAVIEDGTWGKVFKTGGVVAKSVLIKKSKKDQPAPEDGEGYTVDRENGKVVPEEGYEIRAEIGKFATKELPLRYDVPYFVRKAGTDTLNPSPETEFTVSEYFAITNFAPKKFAYKNHGFVTVKESAEEDEFVKIFVHPNKGYELDKLAVVGKDKKFVFVKNNWFKMPANDVTVFATFKAKETPTPTPTPDPTPTDKEKFEAYKTTVKAECDALLVDGDSDAVKALVADAKKAIDAKEYDATKTLDENKAVLDGIVAELEKNIKTVRNDEAMAAAVKKVKVSLTKATAYKNGKIKLTFKRAKASGKSIQTYQIYRKVKGGKYVKYATVTNKKSSKTITYTNSKKLKKGKKYYYKVRGRVQLSDGTYVYTKWSNVKSAKCKKTR